MYKLSFSKGYTERVGEWTIPSPDPPSKKEMLNYGLPDEKQFFVRQPLTDAELSIMDPKDAHDRILEEFHRFENGQWVLIKGKALWFPGFYWFFLNYWWNTDKEPINFRYGALKVAWLWYYICDHPKHYGILIFKLRRFGLTELVLAEQYFTAFRIRGSICGSMHVTDDEALDDLSRSIAVHDLMPKWLKPLTTPDKIKINASELKMYHTVENDDDADAINSVLITGPTKNGTFDGKKMRRSGIREFGKWELHRANPQKQLAILRPCCMDTIGKPLVGKIAYETTVEQVGGGENVKVCKELWDSSGPDTIEGGGTTGSGLLRLMLDTPNYGAYDAWGMPDIEAAKQFVKNIEKTYAKDEAKMIQEKRKYPSNIDDVFNMAEIGAFFSDQGKISRRRSQVLNGQDYQFRRTAIIPRVGRLVWKNGDHDTTVEWRDDPDGPWHITEEPDEPNKKVQYVTEHMPNNKSKYVMGVDPYNSMTDAARTSKGGAVVMRKFDMVLDKMGSVNPGDMLTNRIVCDYQFRHERPDDFYEDMIKTCVYFGCEALYENIRDGMGEYFINRGYIRYLMMRPDQLKTRRAGNTIEIGAPSNTRIISSYTEKLLTYYTDYLDAIHHIRILDQMRTFTNTLKGRGSHDLIVAWGFALEAMEKNVKDQEEDEEQQEEWFREYKI